MCGPATYPKSSEGSQIRAPPDSCKERQSRNNRRASCQKTAISALSGHHRLEQELWNAACKCDGIVTEGKPQTDVGGIEMLRNELARKIGVAALAIAMMLGIGTAFASTAQAQVPGFAQYRGNWDQYRGNWDLDRDDNYGFYNHGFYNHGFYDRGMVIRIAQRNGYNDGFAVGRRDRFSGQGSNCDGSPRYQNAMAGYRFA